MYFEKYCELTNIDTLKLIAFDYLNISGSQQNTINALGDYALTNYEDYDETMKNYYNSNTKVLSLYLQIKEIALDNDFDLLQKINRIKVIENSFDYSGLTVSQISTIKKGLSIARYSLFYWAPVSQGGLGKFDDLIGAQLKTSIGWGQIGIEDAWGAWMGAFTTANPFVALGGGVLTSVVAAGREYIRNS